ncbi:hypothetical protein PINS_up007689 [Pythium insidiosum]|nr:hypothetical protein PINS_up007689 [Pythium insidiosum]
MMDECVVDDFANRLKFEFEDNGGDGDDMDEDQDWFVNDKRDTERSPSPTKSDKAQDRPDSSGGGGTGSASASPLKAKDTSASSMSSPKATGGAAPPSMSMKKSNSAPTVDSEPDDSSLSSCRTAFLHYFPPEFGILVMERGTSDAVLDKRYGTKYFKVYLPQVHDTQTDFCLYARKRLNKYKYRFSLDEYAMTKWSSNATYSGKVVMTGTSASKKFKLVVPKNAPRVHFDIDQEARKQELTVRLNSQSKGFNLFRGRSASTDEPMVEYRSLLQKFINPLADVRCSKTNNTLLKIEKEGVRSLCGWSRKAAGELTVVVVVVLVLGRGVGEVHHHVCKAVLAVCKVRAAVPYDLLTSLSLLTTTCVAAVSLSVSKATSSSDREQ